MLRRLEKGLNNAKLKSQSVDSAIASPYPMSDSRGHIRDGNYNGMRSTEYGSSGTHFPSNELPPLNLPPYHTGDSYAESNHDGRSMDLDEDEDETDRNEDGMFPAKLIRKENQRHSFFRTILNPESEPTPSSSPHGRGESYPTPPPRPSASNGLSDPIAAGIIEEEQAKLLFDLLFLRLNPFVNMFDPALHSVTYVRNKCPFLFTTLIMAGCKFFKPELYKQCRKLANEFAVRAFAEGWKRVEVVQAFTCLTHWKEPDENVSTRPSDISVTLTNLRQRTWTFIGYVGCIAVHLEMVIMESSRLVAWQ